MPGISPSRLITVRKMHTITDCWIQRWRFIDWWPL